MAPVKTLAEKSTRLKMSGSNCTKQKSNGRKKAWSKPTLEDVSGKIMAQPYIRFT